VESECNDKLRSAENEAELKRLENQQKAADDAKRHQKEKEEMMKQARDRFKT